MRRYERKDRRWLAILLVFAVTVAATPTTVFLPVAGNMALAAEVTDRMESSESAAGEVGAEGSEVSDGNDRTGNSKEDDIGAGQPDDGEDVGENGYEPALTAAGDNIASGEINESYGHITWVIDANGKLMVEGTGDFADPERERYNELYIPWYSYSSSVISAVINVTDMKNASYMFCDCRNLSSLDMSHFDTSDVTDMGAMFWECSNLSSLDVSHFDTSKVTDMAMMFDGCSSLNSLDVSRFDTSKVTDMNGMFSGCSSLSSLDVGHFDTSDVTNMGGMFSGCSGLSSLDVSHFDTSKVTYMACMFFGCSSLSSLDVSHFDTSKVTDMNGIFSGCSGLSSLDMSNFDTSKVTDIRSMFSGCSGLSSLDVSHFDTSKVTCILCMFSECSSLNSLDVSHFDTSNVTDMYGMFSGCSGLSSLDVSHFDTSKVTDMSGMFSGCSGLSSLDLNGFDTSDVTEMWSMFSGCSGLNSLDLSGFDTSSVTYMWSMFNGCSGLVSLDLSSFDTSSVMDMSDMFNECSSLTTIYTPCNVSCTVSLPAADSTDKWYRYDGSTVTELPQGLSYSVALGRNYLPEEIKGPDDIIQTELIDTKTHVFRYLDAMTGQPIEGGRVRIDETYTMTGGHYYVTKANGCVEVALSKNCTQVFVSSDSTSGAFVNYQCLDGGWLTVDNENLIHTWTIMPKTSKNVPKFPTIKATAQVSGPDVETERGTVSPFNTDMEFEFNFGRGLKFKRTYDEKKGIEQISFSGEEKWLDYNKIKGEFKKDLSINSLEEDVTELIEKLEKGQTGKVCNAKVKLAVKGYLEYDKYGRLLDGGAIVILKGEGTKEYRPVWTGGIGYGKFKIEITAQGNLKLAYVDGNLTPEAILSLEPSMTIAFGIGWSMCHYELGIKGKMNAKVTFPWNNMHESLSIKAEAEVYDDVKILYGGRKKPITKLGPFTMWPREKSVGESATYSIMSASALSQDTLTVMSRDYLASNNAASVFEASTSLSFVAPDSFRYSEISADSGVFEENNVQYAQLADGTEVLVWVHDFGDKSDTNRTTLVYSVNQNDGKGWTGITPVCDDTSTGDYYPMMLSKDGKAYLVWNKASEVFSDTASVDYASRHMDVYLSVFENGAFTEPVLVSDADNGLMEFAPMVAVNGKDMSVAWLVNSENDYYYSKGTNAIYVRECVDGVWGDVVCYADGLHFVSDYDLEYVDGKAAVAYVEDADNVAETEDGTIHYVSGSVNRTIGDSTYNAGIVDLCRDALYFSGGGELYRAFGVSFSDISDTGIQTDNFMVVKNAVGGEAVTFLAQDGFTSNLYISYCRDGSYTSPVPVVADGSRVTHYAPIYNTDGTVSIAYNEDEVLTDEVYPFGLTDMVVKRKAEPDVFYVNEQLSYNAYDIAPSATVEFAALACNYTAKDVTALQATLNGSVSGKVYEGKITAAIPVGEMRYISVPYTLPETIVNEYYTLTLAPVDFEDRDLSDNTAMCELGYSDIKLEDCKIENNVITGKVINIGYKTAENVTLEIREDSYEHEPIVKLSCEKGSLGIGESWEFSHVVDAVKFESPFDAKYYLFSATTDSAQNNYANDSATVCSEPVAATGISLDNITLTMQEKTSVKLTATVAPAETTFKDVVYTSSDNSVVVADNEGNVYAVGEGTATITVYTIDCNHSVQCAVTVEASAAQYTLSDRGLDLMAGDTAVLSLADENGAVVEDAIWSSVNEAVVTVDAGGRVTAVGEGITLVAVRKDAFADACIVRVKDDSIKQLSCEETLLEMVVGETLKPEIVIVPDDTVMDKDLTYVSANESVATVDAEGFITAVAEGRTEITVTAVNSVDLKLTVVVVTPITYVVSFDSTGGMGVDAVKVTAKRVETEDEEMYSVEYIGYLSSIPTPTRSGYSFKGWYTDRDEKGEILSAETPVKEDVTYYACWEENAYTINLEQEEIVLYLGDSVQLRVTVTPEGETLSYETEDAQIVTVSETGLVTAVGIGTTTVHVTVGKATAQCRITVLEDSDVLPEDVPADGVIPNGLWIAGVSDAGYSYTGAAIKPTVRVYDSKVRLTAGKDYTITYKNNVKAARSEDVKAPTITVKGKGNYSGTETRTFTITKKNISDTDVSKTFTDAYILQAGDKNPNLVFSAKYNRKSLKKNTDYTLTVKGEDGKEVTSYGEAGAYTLVVTGSGTNYTGQCVFTFEVLDKTPVGKLKISKLAPLEYDGTPKQPEPTVKFGSVVLEKDMDYTLSYRDNTEVGTAAVIITGKGDYFGTRSVTFSISGRQMKKVKFAGFQSSAVYTGGHIYQGAATLTYDENPLKEGVDYTVSYSNNLNVGKAVVNYTGIGMYTGTVKKTFKITAFNMAANSGNRISLSDSPIAVSYAKGGAKPDVTLYDGKKLLVQGKDYTLSYRNNNAVTTASVLKQPTITIKGKGNYSGTFGRQKTFIIMAKSLSEVKMTAADVTVSAKAGKYGSIPVLTDTDGRKLKAGTDYEKVYHYTYRDGATVTNGEDMVERKAGEVVDAGDVIPSGTVLCVSVNAKEGGNYTGTARLAEYRVVTASIGKAKITVKNPDMDGKNLFSYTGKPIRIDKRNLTVKVGTDVLTADQYEILEDTYINNVNKGTATVQIKGVGDQYGGTATVKFKIDAKGLWWFWRLFE